MFITRIGRGLIGALAVTVALVGMAAAADYPAPKEGDYIARDFRFSTGETLPEVKLHYTTIGDPANEAVLVIHGTAGTGERMLVPGFAGELFGEGQPLDASKYFIIVPDALGAGKSAKPSDGLRARFPNYNYDDMVRAQYLLVTEGLGVKHLRLVLGNSMGGMHAWLWAIAYPGFMDAIVPMASQPSPMAGRNWIMRRLIIDSVRNDPAWNNGDYTVQPPALKVASTFYALATNGGNQALHKAAPTRALADELLDKRLNRDFKADANDYMYQWDSSRDYDPSAKLETIEAAVLAINSADDERNPPELGIMERELQRIKNARLYLIPASTETSGHGTTMQAKFWKDQLQEFLDDAPRRTF